MSRMVLTQKQLEQQIRNLTGKGKPVSNITTTAGLSNSAITPIDGVSENTMF